MKKVGVLGINHKSAPLDLREQVAHVCCSCKEPDKVILSTCNRTEIYFSSENLAEMQCQLFVDLKKRLNHSSEHAFYSFFDVECFYHLACVTTGIDSKLLAESDIQRQVKIAYETAKSSASLSPELHYLFQKSLKIAKGARSHFSLFQSRLHLEGMIFQIIHSMLEENPSLLFIGNSEVNRKIIHYFSRRKKGRLTLVTRDLHRAYPFALDYGLTLKGREELTHAHLYEGIISATSTSEYLFSSLPSQRHTRLILDLSVPRSIHPKVGMDPSLTLINMEQVGDLFAHAHNLRYSEVEQVKKFIESAVEAYAERYKLKIVFTSHE